MAPLFLRLALGILFLTAGLKKFIGPGPAAFMKSIASDFGETVLPATAVAIFGYLLPFVETALGLFLIAGLYCRTALAATALLLISLSFGKMLTNDYQTVAQNFVFLYAAVGAMLLSDRDTFTLDRWFHR